ncbi:MAG: N-acetylmannosamine-6-phosphate 2-epimerase [Ignavibacteriales bacterium]|nr:N-acetylmannosamine-6-phosphate 2-epimerase [Ignavibacteriales bacterium]
MKEVLIKLKGGLIVSCQSEEIDPFNSPEQISLFAKAAEMGGAVGIRSQGIEKTKKIIQAVNIPVIGLVKTKFPDNSVCITCSFDAIEELLNIGCNIIAIDGTFRLREQVTGPEFITEVKKKFDCTVMADVALYEEGIACISAGADCLSTTLSGYTPETIHLPKDLPDFDLLERLAKESPIPVIAEGKIHSPEFAAEMIKRGAWTVVVGTAITSPRIVTGWYVDAIKNSIKK